MFSKKAKKIRQNLQGDFAELFGLLKGSFKLEDTGEFLLLQNKYSKSLSWAENLNKLFTVLGWKFKFSYKDSDVEYLFWRSKTPPVSSELRHPLENMKFLSQLY